MGLIWTQIEVGDGDRKMVLLALADHAEDDGTSVFPTARYTSWKTDIPGRSVERIFAEFRKMGALVVVRRGGGRVAGGKPRPTEYRLDLSVFPAKPKYEHLEAPRRTRKVNTATVAVLEQDEHRHVDGGVPSGEHRPEGGGVASIPTPPIADLTPPNEGTNTANTTRARLEPSLEPSPEPSPSAATARRDPHRNAGSVTKAYIDASIAAKRGKPTRTFIGICSTAAKEVLDAGHDYDRILALAKQIGTEGEHPSRLHRLALGATSGTVSRAASATRIPDDDLRRGLPQRRAQ